MTRLHCPNCTYGPVSMQEAVAYTCGTCGTTLEPQPRDPVPFNKLIDRDRGLPWRYPTLLPTSYAPDLDSHVVPYTVRSSILETRLGVAEAWLVDCTGLGTGTFKDLEAGIVIAGAKELGLTRISVHSTGNTALAYRHFARRAGIACASYIPRQNVGKLGDVSPDPEYPIYLVDTTFPSVSAVAKSAAALAGWHHLAPIGWKLAGKATLAWWLAEATPQVDLIVQTIAGGYGPLGYETGFRHLSRATDSGGNLPDHRYLLFQPADADTLTYAWQSGANDLNHDQLRLPTDPFESTLQSTNPVATLPLLRATLPAHSDLRTVAPQAVEDAKAWADKVLAEAGISLDYEREKSTYISLAGLLTTDLAPSTRMAFIVTGSRPFEYTTPADVWPIVVP